MPTTQQSPVDGSPASTTQQPRTKDASVYTTQQSPTEYDGPALGRDDPVWLHYLGESTQRDMDLVDGWNKGMDVLLLVWLVSHSQAEKPVNAAIRAVANAIAGPEFWDHLVKDKIITLVAQRFTSFFKGTLDPPESDSKDNSVDEIINSEDLKRQVCSCTRALAKVAKHSTMQLVQDTGPNSTTPERAVKESGRIMLPEAYFISIQNGLYRLTESAYVDIAASGFCGASAWCTSTGRMNRNALEQQPLLRTLVSFLDKKSSQIPNKLLVDVVEALAVETSYMIWELPENEINKTLKLVVELCLPGPPGEPNLLDGPARRAVCVELAVVAALINDYQRIPDAEIDQLSKEGHDKIYGHYTKAHEIYELRYPYPAGSYLTYSRQWRAVWIAELCSKNPKYLEAHSDALLFLGLAGILRSFPMDSKLFIRVIELFIAQLKLESTRVNQSNRMSLPFVLVSSRDIQHQVAQDIFTAFHDPPSESNNESNLPSRSNGAIEAAKIKLLQCLVEHGQWIEFRPVFLVEILKMLKSSRNKEFRRQCIIALDNYWFMNSASGFDVYNPPDWELLIDFNLIHVLVEAFEAIKDEPNETTRLHSSIISCFSKIARTIRVQPSSGLPTTTTKGGSDAQTGSDQAVPQEATGQPELQAVTSQPQGNSAQVTNGQPNQEILEALKWLLRRDKKLFETFLIHIACADSLSQADLDFWRRAICGLFGEPKASPTTQTSATNGNPQAHPDPIPQVPPMGTSPQASTTNLHTRTPDSRTAAANPGPSISTTSASSQPTPTIDSQNSTTGTDRQPPPGSVHNTMASTSQPPATSFSAQVPTAGSDSRTFSSTAANSNAQASTSSGPQAPTSSSPPASASNSATALQPPPMTDDEAREWLRTFANNNVNEEGDLGRMAKDLRDALDKTDG
ncbi:hypothetical protein FRC11_013530 [Ceratobasidium sp. 423]|nr:hypothetical protein FRC11_013530 [Ceratobasidium sp. 423]